MRRLLLIGMLSISASAWAAVPHTFEPGAPALADEVNANFNAVANAAEVNSNNVTLVTDTADTNAAEIADLKVAVANSGNPALNWNVFDGNGVKLGTLLNHSGATVTFITPQGYIADDVNVFTGEQGGGYAQHFFKSTDCTLQAGGLDNEFVHAVYQSPGTVHTLNGQIYYVVREAGIKTLFGISSSSSGSDCDAVTPKPTGAVYYVATPNNPAVTGISTFVGPLTFSQGN